MNIFDKLNKMSKNNSVEADKIADSIPGFLLSTKDASQYKKIDLYNMWLQKTGIVPSSDELAVWTLEFLYYAANHIPNELFQMQLTKN